MNEIMLYVLELAPFLVIAWYIKYSATGRWF